MIKFPNIILPSKRLFDLIHNRFEESAAFAFRFLDGIVMGVIPSHNYVRRRTPETNTVRRRTVPSKRVNKPRGKVLHQVLELLGNVHPRRRRRSRLARVIPDPHAPTHVLPVRLDYASRSLAKVATHELFEVPRWPPKQLVGGFASAKIRFLVVHA